MPSLVSRCQHSASTRLVRAGVFSSAATFRELEERIAALTTAGERGDAFEVFAEAYLATQPTIQAADVWPFELIPHSLKAQLRLPRSSDQGIDGVVKTRTGELHAYQVKFRTGRARPTWTEISTFFGLADRADQRIVFTNAPDLGTTITERRDFYCITSAELDALSREDLSRVLAWIRGEPLEVQRHSPRAHQQEAIDSLTPVLLRDGRATALMACGTGKTLVGLWIAERLDAKRVLVLVPSLALMRQTLHEWLRETRWTDFDAIAVCSDPTVAPKTDEVVLSQTSLDFPVITDPTTITRFLQRESPRKILFSTYQSAPVVAGSTHDAFDFGVFDEAHRTAGRDGKLFSFALTDANLPVERRLFMTATPRHYDVRRRDKSGDVSLVYSMDNRAAYGDVAYELSFRDAVQEDIICDYKLLISVVSGEEVTRDLVRKSDVVVDGVEVKAAQVANQIALAKAFDEIGAKKAFTFHSSVASAQSFTGDGPAGIRTHLPDVATFHVNGAMSAGERAAIITEFRTAERAVMSNARCLTEGVDVPAVDLVAFLSPKESRVDIVQAAGRAMRKRAGKTVGYVLVPVLLNDAEAETLNQALDRTNFDTLWAVLQAISEQDHVLADVIRALREERGRGLGFSDFRLREHVEVLAPALGVELLQTAIHIRAIDALGSTWDERLGELLAFKERTGHSNVPQNWNENPILARWVNTQRNLKQQGDLPAERVDRLEAIGFVWNARDADWWARYAVAREYWTNTGDCHVPEEVDRETCRWLRKQRDRVRENRKSLTDERKHALDAIGFDWSPQDSAFERQLERLKRYKDRFGNADVPHSWSEDLTLGRWVTKQRRRKDMLSEVQVAALDALGFNWAKRHESHWERNLTQLTDFVREHGHCNVPDSHDQRLANFVGNCRALRSREQLSPERVAALEALGFEWQPRDDAWWAQFQALKAYRETKGHCRVPQEYSENLALGRWVARQRAKKNALSAEQVAALDSLRFEFEARETRWWAGFERLKNYQLQIGDCDVPRNWEDRSLANWVFSQRSRRDRLSAEQIAALDDLGFSWRLKRGPRPGQRPLGEPQRRNP